MFHPLTSRLIMMGGLFAALVLAGCGGGDSGADNALRADLEVLQEDFNDLQADLKDAQDDLKEAEEAKEAAEGLAKDAAEDLADAQSDTADAITNAQRERDEARRQAQTLEANQRAEKLKAAFPGGGDSTMNLPAIEVTSSTDVPVVAPVVAITVTVPPSVIRLTLKRGGHTTATLSGSGTRSATMALTNGSDSGKTVVYTDRELSKPLLEYFGSLRDSSDMTRFNLTGDLALGSDEKIFRTSTQWAISVPTSLVPTSVPTTLGNMLPGNVNEPKTPGNSYAGSLHGLLGRFVCGGQGGENCQVQVTPDYSTDPVGGRHALLSVKVAATTGMLYFKPSGSPSLQLYEGGPVGADDEYMAFGYWREDPTSPAADYNVGVFAQVFSVSDSADIPSNITAMYDGTAVGMYVEQDPNNAVDTHRQGEFTADVDLRVSGNQDLTGTIDDFVTTPTGGSAAPRTSARWVVDLLGSDLATIRNLPGVKNGIWKSSFVPAHKNASDATPPAVTGTFNTRVLDFVHLLGAFGADKR